MQKRILIFDQDQDFACTLAGRLETLGVQVVVMTNRTDAVARLTWDDFDMVCVDVDVESGRGLAFCEFMTWNVDTRTMPVVVMTARSHPDEIRRCCDFRPQFLRKSANLWPDLEALVLKRWPQLAPEAQMAASK